MRVDVGFGEPDRAQLVIGEDSYLIAPVGRGCVGILPVRQHREGLHGSREVDEENPGVAVAQVRSIVCLDVSETGDRIQGVLLTLVTLPPGSNVCLNSV